MTTGTGRNRRGNRSLRDEARGKLFRSTALIEQVERRVLLSTSTPFLGHPVNIISDTIEAENFDSGGEGVACHDTTPQNVNGKYRLTEAVDINSGGSNGYSVGYTAPGEWLNYSITAPAQGSYALKACVANSKPGGTFHVEIDGQNVTGTMCVPDSGPWDTWTTITSKAFTVSVGNHVMRFVMDQPGYWGNIGDFDSFKFSSSSGAYKGTPLNINADTIEAENFNNGGEGVAYHDTTPGNQTGLYRPVEGVDINNGGSNAYSVGYTAPGEWLTYSVTAPSAGAYTLRAMVADLKPGGTFHVEIDGVNATGTMCVPDTGGWFNWQTLTSPAFNVSAGDHTMKVVLDAGGYWGNVGNFDSFKFVASTPPSSHLTSITNGSVTVGIDLWLGGSITLLKSNSDGRNFVDTFDPGREIQPSYYSGPTNYNPNGTLSPIWPNWPWNPIQAGDVYGNGSQVVSWSKNGSTIYVKTIPKQWALIDYPADAVIESWISLSGNVVNVTNRLTNQRTDSTQYPAWDQELPAIYTSPAFPNLYTYNGTQPYTYAPVTRITNSGPPWQYWRGTESWAAHVDANNFGLGVFADHDNYFIGGYCNAASPFAYIAPLQHEILDRNIVYTNQYQLIVGSLTDIRNYAYQHHTNPAPNYSFTSDRQHWFSVNTSDWIQNGAWHVNLAGNTGFLISAPTAYPASSATKLDIRAAYTLSGWGSPQARVYWELNNGNGSSLANFVAGQCFTFNLIADGQYHDYVVDLSKVPNYAGLISELRFDPIITPSLTGSVSIASISAYP